MLSLSQSYLHVYSGQKITISPGRHHGHCCHLLCHRISTRATCRYCPREAGVQKATVLGRARALRWEVHRAWEKGNVTHCDPVKQWGSHIVHEWKTPRRMILGNWVSNQLSVFVAVPSRRTGWRSTYVTYVWHGFSGYTGVDHGEQRTGGFLCRGQFELVTSWRVTLHNTGELSHLLDIYGILPELSCRILWG